MGVPTAIRNSKLNEVDPQAWLAHVLANIADTPRDRLHELLPWNCKTGAAEATAA